MFSPEVTVRALHAERFVANGFSTPCKRPGFVASSAIERAMLIVQSEARVLLVIEGEHRETPCGFMAGHAQVLTTRPELSAVGICVARAAVHCWPENASAPCGILVTRFTTRPRVRPVECMASPELVIEFLTGVEREALFRVAARAAGPPVDRKWSTGTVEAPAMSIVMTSGAIVRSPREGLRRKAEDAALHSGLRARRVAYLTAGPFVSSDQCKACFLLVSELRTLDVGEV